MNEIAGVKSYKFGPYRLERHQKRLFLNDELVALTPKRFEILLMLVEKAGQVIRKEEMMNRVWPGQAVEESNLTQHIFFLRRTLGDDPRTPSFIMTIPGAGYLFYQSVLATRDDGSEELIGGFQAPTEEENSPSPAPPVSADQPPPVASQRLVRYRSLGLGVGLGLFILLAGLLSGYLYRQSRQNRSAGNSPSVQPIVTIPGLKGDLAFSRDGKILAFTSEGDSLDSQNIYLNLRPGQEPTRLTTHPYNDHSLAWSPDNTRIAFLRSGNRIDRKNQLFVIPVSGGRETEIARVWHGLDWAPDGQNLAICDNEGNGSPTGIYLLSIDGTKRLPVSQPPAGENIFDSDPKFSPNGSEIAFTRWTSNSNSDLFVVDLQSRKLRQLTSDRIRIGSIQWTANGKELLFVSNRSGNYRVWKIAREGGAPTPVEGFLGEVNRLAVSPLDESLAYTRLFSDTNIIVENLAGRGIAAGAGLPCTVNSTRADDSPQFSPDGSRFAFMSSRSGFEEIWIANSDCSQPTQLTKFNQLGVGSPRWSPDGRSIVFDRHLNEQSDIFTIEIASGEVRQLTNHPAPDFLPSWSADGREIFFCSERAAITQIWKIPVTGGEPVMVTRYGGRESWAGPDGRTLYFSRFDHLWKLDLATSEEWRIDELKDHPVGRYWTVQGSGLYYLTREIGNKSRVHRLDLVTRQNSTVREFPSSPARFVPGLSISPDEGRVVISLITYQSSDISLLKGWR